MVIPLTLSLSFWRWYECKGRGKVSSNCLPHPGYLSRTCDGGGHASGVECGGICRSPPEFALSPFPSTFATLLRGSGSLMLGTCNGVLQERWVDRWLTHYGQTAEA